MNQTRSALDSFSRKVPFFKALSLQSKMFFYNKPSSAAVDSFSGKVPFFKALSLSQCKMLFCNKPHQPQRNSSAERFFSRLSSDVFSGKVCFKALFSSMQQALISSRDPVQRKSFLKALFSSLLSLLRCFVCAKLFSPNTRQAWQMR